MRTMTSQRGEGESQASKPDHDVGERVKCKRVTNIGKGRKAG
jgi:hypothetical protein